MMKNEQNIVIIINSYTWD